MPGSRVRNAVPVVGIGHHGALIEQSPESVFEIRFEPFQVLLTHLINRNHYDQANLICGIFVRFSGTNL